MWKLFVGVFFLFMWLAYGEIINMLSCFPLSFETKREYGKPCLAIGSALLISYFGFTGKLVIGIVFSGLWFLYGEYKNFSCHRPLSFWERREEGLPFFTVGGTALILCIAEKTELWQRMLSGLPYFAISIIFTAMLIIGVSLACEFIKEKLNRDDMGTVGVIHCVLGSILLLIGSAPLLL